MHATYAMQCKKNCLRKIVCNASSKVQYRTHKKNKTCSTYALRMLHMLCCMRKVETRLYLLMHASPIAGGILSWTAACVPCNHGRTKDVSRPDWPPSKRYATWWSHIPHPVLRSGPPRSSMVSHVTGCTLPDASLLMFELAGFSEKNKCVLLSLKLS